MPAFDDGYGGGGVGAEVDLVGGGVGLGAVLYVVLGVRQQPEVFVGDGVIFGREGRFARRLEDVGGLVLVRQNFGLGFGDAIFEDGICLVDVVEVHRRTAPGAFPDLYLVVAVRRVAPQRQGCDGIIVR